MDYPGSWAVCDSNHVYSGEWCETCWNLDEMHDAAINQAILDKDGELWIMRA